MQPIPQPKKNAATFRIKKARKIEIVIKQNVLKRLTVQSSKTES